MELWDLYTRDRIKTGKTMVRGTAQPEGLCHLVVHVCLFDAGNRLLIQHRQPFKHGWSGMWDVSVGGSAVAGDDSRTAAHRETLEELGLDLDFSDRMPDLTLCDRYGFDDFYLVRAEVDPKTLHLQYEEVSETRWATCEEVLRMVDLGTFIPWNKSFLCMLFEKMEVGGMRFRQDTTVPAPFPDRHA